MELTGQQLLPLPRDRVWSALLDPVTLRAAIPGCEFVTDEGEGVFAVGVLAAVGPVKARFKGRMRQQDLQPPQRYTLSFEGDGGMAGFAKGSAEVELTEEGDDRAQTRLTYRAQAQIGGRLAQIGARLVDATAARMSTQFFERLTQTIVAPAGASAVSGEPRVAAAATDAAATRQGAASMPASASVSASALPAGAPAVPHPAHGVVTLQMPAWTWVITVVALAGLVGWLAAR
ncbi:MAG: CoxG family protein [Lautropia sp.]